MSQGPAISTQPYQTGRFVPRNSDAAAYDFTLANFTIDTAWHDLDLSAIVPAGAIAVLVQWGVRNSTNADIAVALRRNGMTNTIEIVYGRSIAVNVISPYNLMVPCDANRVIEYRITNVGTWDYLSMIVTGWWI